MVPCYSIHFDEAHGVLRIVAHGFWTRETLAAFGDELIARMEALRARGRSFTVLADAGAFPVQSIAVSTGFMGIVRRLDRDLLVPTAVVAGGALLRLQALRVLVAPHIRIFASGDEALAWLAEKSPSARAA